MKNRSTKSIFLVIGVMCVILASNGCRTTNSSSTFKDGDDDWQHQRLKSSGDTDSVEINIDYKYRDNCERYQAEGRDHRLRLVDPVFFNVVGVPDGKTVKARIEFYQQERYPHGSKPGSINRMTNYYDRDVDFKFEDNHYSVNPNSIVVRHDCGSSNQDDRVFQRLRFTIDGKALKDPISNSEWFEISMDNGKSCN